MQRAAGRLSRVGPLPVSTDLAYINLTWRTFSFGRQWDRARVAQPATHAGASPRVTRSKQPSHLTTLPVDSSHWGTFQGQAPTHARQPTQSVRTTCTSPSSARLTMAPVGHAATHHGLSQ